MADKDLLPVYLCVGAHEVKRNETIAHLKAYVDPAMSDFNLEERDGAHEEDPQNLLASLAALPLADTIRIVIVHNADRLPKPVSEALIGYLKNPNPTTTILLVAEKLARSTRLYKAVAAFGKQSVIVCEPPSARELPDFVVKFAKSSHKTMSYEAAFELVDRVGNSTVMLQTQVGTLVQFVGERNTIEKSDVEAHVSRTAEVAPWGFLDAVSERDLPKALKLYRSMSKPLYPLLQSLLCTRIRELICARSLAERGQSALVADVLKKQKWMVKNHVRWARTFTDGELEHDLRLLADLERAIKGSGNEEVAFIDCIAQICGPR